MSSENPARPPADAPASTAPPADAPVRDRSGGDASTSATAATIASAADPASTAPAPDAAIAPAPDAAIAPDVAAAAAAAANAPPTPTVTPPPTQTIFAKGDKVSAFAAFDSTRKHADVLEVRRPAGFDPTTGDPAKISYYVRYDGFDKRLDAWVSGDKLWPAATRTKGSGVDLVGGGSSGIDGKGNAGSGLTDGVTPDGAEGDLTGAGGATRKMTRTLKRRYNEINNVGVATEDLTALDQKLEHEHDERTKVKNIGIVECGKYEVDAWYFSPYPEEYQHCDRLYVCEHCLKYMRKERTLLKHKARCAASHPPGKRIYEHPRKAEGKPTVSFWEIDGAGDGKVYCQNLCLLAKLFLDHKTLYYDVSPFLFYVMTEEDETTGKHSVVGYFSKEKWSVEDYNLACILTLPPYQRRGYGSFLIAMSYELSSREEKLGTPERPLSDLGQVSYRSFWSKRILEVLQRAKGNLSVKDISAETSFKEMDIVSSLQSLNLLKYWKGQHIISATPKIIEEHLKTFTRKNAIEINPDLMRWTPPVFAPPPNPRKGGANRQ
jgi:histone acetyltransferase MYST1